MSNGSPFTTAGFSPYGENDAGVEAKPPVQARYPICCARSGYALAKQATNTRGAFEG